MPSNFGHFQYCDYHTLGSYLNPMENFLCSCFSRYQPDVQSVCSNQLSVDCGFKVNSVFKAFAVQFRSSPCVHRLGLRPWSVLFILQLSKSTCAKETHFIPYLLKIYE